MRAEYFFGFTISFIVGVALESLLNFGYPFALLGVILSSFVFLTQRSGSYSRSVLFVSLILLGCAVGILRVDVSQIGTSAHSLDSFTGEVTQVRGTIVDEPDVREGYSNVVLEVQDVLYHERRFFFNSNPLILVRVPVYPELTYGDDVTMVGKLSAHKNFSPKDGTKAFDYQSYLAKDNIYYQMYFPKTTIVSHDKGNTIRKSLFVLKGWFIKNISENIPEPESSLAAGVTLGAKQSLGDELMQKFRETGVAHIVVLSGYNIAVVAGIFSRLVVFMPFTIRLITSGVGIVLFAVMVGGGATVVRATAMALVVIFARLLGREESALRALVLVGGVMVFVNPMILLHDVSFQLSFSAIHAIITLVPILEKYFIGISNQTLREIVVTTLSTQIFVLPLILYYMGSVSLVGFIANIFILPVVPFAMLVVAVVAVLAWVPLVGSIFALASYLVLAYVILAVNFFARVPFASLHNISFSISALLFSYALLGVFIAKYSSSKKFAKELKSEF